MLEVKEIHKSFARKPLLKGVSFGVKEGEIVGMVGPSGSGKSVLLKIMAGIIKPDSGEVRLDSEVISGKSSASIGFLFQGGALFDSLTVLENTAYPLLESPLNRGKYSYEEAMQRSYEILKIVGLGKAVDKLPGQLSGGMNRRAGIARALVAEPRLVMLDEPTGGLDPVAAQVIMDLISSLHKRYNPCIVLVSNDIRRVLPNVERLIAIFDGHISHDGAPARLISEANDRVIGFLETRYDFQNNSLE